MIWARYTTTDPLTHIKKQLKNYMTQCEIMLWSQLKSMSLLGYKFRRQYSIGKYIVDFCCPQKRLVVEVDGETRLTPRAMQYDQDMTVFINKHGYSVISFMDSEVVSDVESVLSSILFALDA